MLGGCGLEGVEGVEEKTQTINGIDYWMQGNQVAQISGKLTSRKILVMGDTHGCLQNHEKLIARAPDDVDFVVLLGDYISLWNLRETHLDEIYGAIERAAKTGKPVFALNGNHDNQFVFEAILADLAQTYPNVIDVRRLRKIDLKGVNFIGSPGGSDYTFILNGFRTDTDSIEEIRKLEAELADGDPTIVLSHPFKEVDNLFYAHTHIRAAEDSLGNEIPAGQWTASLRFNPGAVSPDYVGCGIGSAGIVEVDPEKGMRYEYFSSE